MENLPCYSSLTGSIYKVAVLLMSQQPQHVLLPSLLGSSLILYKIWPSVSGASDLVLVASFSSLQHYLAEDLAF